MSAPYSYVCRAGHVLADEMAHEPARDGSGSRRCSESGCFELVYSHCPTCGQAIPGYIDGPRYETHGRLSVPRGRLGPAGLGARVWREDCPHCKAPYPWARMSVKAAYHRRYLKDQQDGVALPLSHVPDAEAAYRAGEASKAEHAKRREREERRARLSAWGAHLDTWPKRIAGAAAAIGAVLALLFGANSITGVFGGANHQPSSPPPTSTVPSGRR